jgi:hypothetical protein
MQINVDYSINREIDCAIVVDDGSAAIAAPARPLQDSTDPASATALYPRREGANPTGPQITHGILHY